SGFTRRSRHVIGHLAITGGMAVGDSLVQQMLGHGIAAKLSQRLGEGVLNGLLTARLGLAAIDVTRPLPFTALPRPALGDLAKDLLKKRDGEEGKGAASSPLAPRAKRGAGGGATTPEHGLLRRPPPPPTPPCRFAEGAEKVCTATAEAAKLLIARPHN